MNPQVPFAIGDLVRIRAGAFQAFTATVAAVDERHATVRVMVKVFGRREAVELQFVDVEKISFTEEE